MQPANSTALKFRGLDLKSQYGKDKVANRTSLRLALVGLALNLLTIFFVAFSLNSLPPEVPLFYGMVRGSMQIAPKYFLVIPSVAALLIVAINFFISLLTDDKFLKHTLIASSILASLFSLVTTIKIIFLVGNL